MASFHRLPENFERVVIVGGLSHYGATLGASLALSPFLCPHQKIVLANAIHAGSTAGIAGDHGRSSSSDESPVSAMDAELVNEAQATLAAIRREVARSRTELCHDGTQPTVTSRDALPFQHFLGHQYPGTKNEVETMLDRVVLHVPGQEGATAPSPNALPVHTDRDVLLCVLNADVQTGQRHPRLAHEAIVDQIQRALTTPCGPSGDASASSLFSQGCVVALTDDRSRHALAPLVQAMATPCPEANTAESRLPMLVVCRARELTAPALEYGVTKVAVKRECGGGSASMLTTLCAGTLLGVLSELPVYRHEATPFVPVDLAMNVAFTQLTGNMQALARHFTAPAPNKSSNSTGTSTTTTALLRDHEGAPTAAGRWQSLVAVEPRRSDGTMVWGMFGEYLSDYYGRYASAIRAAFPHKALLPNAPAALNFRFSPADTANYGLDTVDATRCLEHKAAAVQRKKLSTSLPATWKYADFISALDRQVARVQGSSRTPPTSDVRQATAIADVTGLPRSLQEKIPGLAPSTVTSSDTVSPPPPTRSASASPASRPTIASSTLLAQLAAPITTRRGGPSDAGAYERLLLSLAADPLCVPLLSYTALSTVDWNMYVCFIARVVLDCLAERTAGGTTSASVPPASATEPSFGLHTAGPLFPFPTRMFTNDLAFVEEYSAPAQQSLIRRSMGIADWVCRCGMNANGVRGEMVPGFTPKRMAALLAQPRVVKTIEATTAAGLVTTGKDGKGTASKEEVVKRAKRILVRIGDTQNHVQCRTIGVLVYQLFHKVYNRVQLNRGAFERLRRLDALPRTTIVYIPLHRSYSDFLIMSYLLIVMGLRPPHIVAGEDFLRLGKFSELMRGSGAFFMRRTFRGDPLYGALFKEYVAQMVLSGMPLEFFIEGTRSRTGKTMLPKMGILKFITDAFLEPTAQRNASGNGAGNASPPAIDDVLFVPVSLSYDELLEAKVYADELLGIPKPKESVPNMIKAATQLKHKYGNVNIHFSEPISLKAVRENPYECPVPFQPKDSADVKPSATTSGSHAARSAEPATKMPTALSFPSTSRTPAHLLTSLAWRITYQLQQHVVITAPALVAAAFETLMPLWERERLQAERKARGSPKAMDAVTSAPLGLPRARIVEMTEWIAHAVQLRGGNLLPSLTTADAHRGGHRSVDWEAVVTGALRNLARFLKPERPPRGQSSPATTVPQVQTVRYDPPTITSQLGVNISTNQLIHVFIDEAVVAVAMHAHGEALVDGTDREIVGRCLTMPALRTTTQFLRSLLSTEFPNFSLSSPCSYDSWLQYALSRLSLGEEEKQGLGRCRRLRTTHYKGHITGASVPGARYAREAAVVPNTRLYEFLLQLLLPHVEALYVVAVTALACFEATELAPTTVAGGHPPLLVRHLTTAAHKAAQRLFEERLVDYVVACNKETVDHYFQSLVDRKLLRTHTVVDLGLAYIPGEACGASGATGQKGHLSALPQLAGLEKLVAELQALRWHPSQDPQEDVGITKRTVLTCYHALSRGAKL